MISWALKQQQHNDSSTNTWLTAFPKPGSFAIDDEEERAEQSVSVMLLVCLPFWPGIPRTSVTGSNICCM